MPLALTIIIFLWAVSIGASIILIPLLASMAMAYLLHPIVSWFERRGWSHDSSVMMTITAATLLGILLLIFIVPPFWTQIMNSYHKALTMVDDSSQAQPLFNKIRAYNPQLYELVKKQLESSTGKFSTIAVDWMKGGLFKLVNMTASILDLLLIPFFVYYILADYTKMRDKIDMLTPPRYKVTLSALISQVNFVLSSYVRSQMLIALVMGALYSIGFLIIGVPLGLSLGLLTGLLNFIPYIGTLTGLILSLTFTILNGGGIGSIIAVCAVFIIVQCVEGYYLTPKFLGARLNLHPLWVLAGLVIGGNLFGLIGVVLSVPVIAIFKVLFHFMESIYIDTDFYRSQSSAIHYDPDKLLIGDLTRDRKPKSIITTGEIKSRQK